MLQDTLYIFYWWSTLFIVGVFFLPLTIYFFESFIDNGYLFSKIIGIIVISYVLFLLGILHINSFNKLNVFSIFSLVVIIAIICNTYTFTNKSFIKKMREYIKKNYLLFIGEELLFFITLFFWSMIRGYQPDI